MSTTTRAARLRRGPGPVGMAIRTMRERRRMTKRALSLVAGLSESYVGKVESGEIEPSVRTFGMLARALAMTSSEITAVVLAAGDR